MAKKARGFISPYRTYMFKDKDPVIDFVRTKVDDSKMSYAQISDNSGVSKATLYNWSHGKTRRPQFATTAAALMSCGVDQISLRKLIGNGK